MFFWDTVQEPNLNDQKWTNRVLSLSPKMLRVLQIKMSGSLLVPLEDCRQVVARSPGFVRIFQARMLFYTHLGYPNLLSLYLVRLLLKGVSWDDIMATLSIMRSITGGGSQERAVAGTITILALSLELYPANILGLISNLGCGLLRLIQRKGVAGSIPYSWNHFDTYGAHLCWGILIRCSPPLSLDLLSQLYEFVPPWDWFSSRPCPNTCLCVDDFYHVVQWLKALPDPPLELIDQWQGYLTKSRDRFSQGKVQCRFNNNDEKLESNWQKSELKCFNNSCAKFHAFDEEDVIWHWEQVLQKRRKLEHPDDSYEDSDSEV
ncbi:hypothetical protein MVEN_02524000 [Mycena venus]|uniref:Uncharacterized protein n=1 Tax=Mycena venus TaxID=2733690 RepID=A0A8H6WUN4_9AGAR|nr:hypothetical protein MVEN_02524000 [Mycena venus]